MQSALEAADKKVTTQKTALDVLKRAVDKIDLINTTKSQIPIDTALIRNAEVAFGVTSSIPEATTTTSASSLSTALDKIKAVIIAASFLLEYSHGSLQADERAHRIKGELSEVFVCIDRLQGLLNGVMGE